MQHLCQSDRVEQATEYKASGRADWFLFGYWGALAPGKGIALPDFGISEIFLLVAITRCV
jgi:hypothetical protein